jgi:DNA polymerase-3 subunit delta
MPFLSEKRLIIIKDLLADNTADTQEKIIESLENTPDFCVLVFVENKTPDRRLSAFKHLSKTATTEEFQPPNPIQLTNWILKETQERKGSIAKPEAEFLGGVTGPDLWKLSNEINKLISSTNGTPITKKLIEDLVTPSLSSSIFKLTDALAGKNRHDSLRIFKTLVDSGEDPAMIFYMIARHFRILIQTHFLANQGDSPQSIAKKLKQHPFAVMNAFNQSKNFTSEKLKEMYAQLLEIDKSFKTGKIKITVEDNSELLLELEKLIIQACS